MSSSSGTRSTTCSISALFREHAQLNSSTSQNCPSPLPDYALSLIPLSGNETLFTVHPYRTPTDLVGEQESVSSLIANNTADLLYPTFQKKL